MVFILFILDDGFGREKNKYKDNEFELEIMVSQLIGHKAYKILLQFLVRWEGYMEPQHYHH